MYPLHEELLRHDNFVRNLARSLVFDDQTADDVVQETWLAVLRNPPESLVSARAWLARVVRNFAYKLARDEGRRIQRETASARPEAVPSAAEVAEREAARRRIVDAANALDAPMRETLLLRYMEGLPPREVAKRLGIPVETVRSRVRNIREQLRRDLDAEYGDRQAWCLALLPLAALRVPPHSAAGAGLEASAHAGESAGRALQTWSRLGTRIGQKAANRIAVASVATLAVIVALVLWTGRTDEITVTPDDAMITARASSTTSSTDAPIGTEAGAGGRSMQFGAGASRSTASRPASVDADATGSLIVRTLDARTGAPVPWVRVDVSPANAESPLLEIHAVQTDASGESRLDRLPAGDYGVQAFHAGWTATAVTVERSRVNEFEVSVEGAPTTVDGIVVDGNGNPVDGARIWVYGNDLGGQTARDETSTDAAGRFELRGMFEDTYVGARATDLAPSGFQRVGAWRDPDAADGMRLTLGGPAGRLEFYVTDAVGEPVPGAVIDIGHSSINRVVAPVEPRAPFRLRADANGRAVTPAMPRDFHAVTIRAARHGIWNESVEVHSGEITTIHAKLGAGVTLEGRVFDSKGNPAAGANVEIVEPTFVSFHSALTAGDGSYRIEGIGHGDLFLTCTAEIDGRFERVIESSHAAAGAVLEWNPTLHAPLPIAGVVVEADGSPVPDCAVLLVNEGFEYDREVTRTDADGGFRFDDPTAESYRLEARAHPWSDRLDPNAQRSTIETRFDSNPDGLTDRPTRFAIRPGTRAGDDALRIELGPRVGAGNNASVIGIVAPTSDSRIATGHRVVLEHEQAGPIASVPASDHAVFQVDDIPPGLYRVVVESLITTDRPHDLAAADATNPTDPIELSNGVLDTPRPDDLGSANRTFAPHSTRGTRDSSIAYVGFQSDFFTLEPGSVHDLGTLSPEPPGSLEVRIEGIDADEAAVLRVSLLAQLESEEQFIEVRGGFAHAAVVRPGPYRIRIEGGTFLPYDAPVAIEPGETTEVRHEPRPGRAVALRFYRAAATDAAVPMHLVIRDRAGNVVLEDGVLPAPFGREYLVRFVLPQGHYEIEASTEDGSRARGALELTAVGTAVQSLPLTSER